MEFATDKETIWATFELNESYYGIAVEHVREFVLTPSIVKIPKTPPYVRGVINLRNATIPIVDLRMKFGLPSMEAAHKEMAGMLAVRKQDHIDWLDALNQSVREKIPFKKALDPNMCAFGVWYNSYKTDDLTLTNLLEKFDQPHKAIHAIGEKVLSLSAQGKDDEALGIIEEVSKHELQLMIKLFDATIREIGSSSRQVVIITEFDGRVVGFLVDWVESVVSVKPDELGPVPNFERKAGGEAVVGIARPKGLQNKMILLLDPEKVCASDEM